MNLANTPPKQYIVCPLCVCVIPFNYPNCVMGIQIESNHQNTNLMKMIKTFPNLELPIQPKLT